MKNKSKFILKILAAVVAAALIGIMIFTVNSLVGNPISAMLANKAVEKYIDENYADLDLESEKSKYNFKTGSYMVKVRSKTSIDTHFYVYYKNGRDMRDDYESYVLGMFNTLERLSQQYTNLARDIAAKQLAWEGESVLIIYEKDEHSNDILQLDMKFDKSLPLKSEVLLRLELSDHSLENIAEVLTKAHKVFTDNGCNFNKYSLYTQSEQEEHVSVHGVTPDHIKSGRLTDLLTEARDNEGSGEIYVFIKGDKN